MEKVLIIITMIVSLLLPITAIVMPLISIFIFNTGINGACIMCWCFLPIFIFISIMVINCGKEEFN